MDPTTDTNVVVVGNEFYDGKEVEFACSRDEVLDPEISKKLTCEKGKWNGIIPKCKGTIKASYSVGAPRSVLNQASKTMCRSKYKSCVKVYMQNT